MANYIIDGSLLTNIAAAIRSKKGVSTTYTPAAMATAINGLSVKKTEVTRSVSSTTSSTRKITATLNGSIDAIKSVKFRTRTDEVLTINLDTSTQVSIQPVSGTFAGGSPSIESVTGYVFSIQ